MNMTPDPEHRSISSRGHLPIGPRIAAAVLLFAVNATAALCAEAASIAEARQAISEDIPQAAIVKLTAALATTGLDAGDRATALRLLAEAQLNAERPSEALDALAALGNSGDAESAQLRALALAASSRCDEALPIFHTLARTAAAVLGEAECLQALGRTREAVEVLTTFVRSGQAPPAVKMRLANLLIELGKTAESREILQTSPAGTVTEEFWRRYLDARIHLLEKKPEAALADLAPLLGVPGKALPAGLTQNLFSAAKLAEATAKLARGGTDAAEKTLESFLLQNPDSRGLDAMFRRLDQIYALEKNPGEGALLSMADEMPDYGAGLAQFYLARLQLRQKLTDRAAASLEKFLARFTGRKSLPDHPMTPYVHAMLADVALARGDFRAAENALDAASRSSKSDDLRGQFALRTALINLQQREFVRASTGFRAAGQQSPALKQRATFDAALAWLNQKNHERFAEEFRAYVAEFPDPIRAGDLRIEESLVAARSHDARAASALNAFLTEYPNHPRRAEAKVALAELALVAGNTAEAAKLADAAASESTASPEMIEQREYLAIFAEDAKPDRDEEKITAGAKEFIARHPLSPLLAEVRMKLGEVYFHREDFLKAQEQFETLAHQQPDGPYGTRALFLAGQCSMRLLNDNALKHALELFATVAERHDSLEFHARLQQAIIKGKLGATDDAVRIYESILSAPQPAEPEVRLAALTGKGDSLVALGKADPKQLTAAIATYDQVVAAPGTSPTWRNQAAYKKAKALQQLEKNDEAIAVFYDILNSAGSGPRETFWFSKAGFDAAGIAESRREWKSAVGIYEKMAAIPGPHVGEAKQRAKTLRLEHFLWN